MPQGDLLAEGFGVFDAVWLSRYPKIQLGQSLGQSLAHGRQHKLCYSTIAAAVLANLLLCASKTSKDFEDAQIHSKTSIGIALLL